MLQVICYLINLYVLVLLVSIVLSWFPLSGDGFMSQVQRVLRSLTEPVLAPLRSLLPPVRMGMAALDLSPLVLLIGLQVLRAFICS